MKHLSEFRDPDIARRLAGQIRNTSQKPVRLMEVCGTHTMAIFRSGIRSLLPETICLLSGPGCPVCVTAQGEIDAFLALAREKDVIVTTFGDLMRVPGSGGSLQKERARGKDVRTVYSTFDALEIARSNPDKTVVFLGVGFETTAPTIAASIVMAQQQNIKNYAVYCAHKAVPPALTALLDSDAVRIHGFLLPGHVSVIIGKNAYRPVVDRFHIPSVIAGFEPTDILHAVLLLVRQIESGSARLQNAYRRAVTDQGNVKAQEMMADVFDVTDAVWRGIGVIPGSGFSISDAYADFDAARRFDIEVETVEEPGGCACGDILTGRKTPPECPLFKKRCVPENPVGPCMVSSEGTCAAYYRYHAA